MAKKKPLVTDTDYEIEIETSEVLTEDIKPLPHQPEWTEYVLSHLTDDEKVDGNPTTDGLRRLVEYFVGEIVENKVEAVRVEPEWSTIKHTVGIMTSTGVRRHEEIADIHRENIDPRFLRFASATASTRAEGRALKKALKLKKVLTAEEILVGEPSINSTKTVIADPNKMDAMQANMLNAMFAKLNINGWKYIQEILSFIAPATKYETLNDIPKEYVAVISEHVQKYQQIDTTTGEVHQVPKSFVGYSNDFLTHWRGTL